MYLCEKILYLMSNSDIQITEYQISLRRTEPRANTKDGLEVRTCLRGKGWISLEQRVNQLPFVNAIMLLLD